MNLADSIGQGTCNAKPAPGTTKAFLVNGASARALRSTRSGFCSRFRMIAIARLLSRHRPAQAWTNLDAASTDNTRSVGKIVPANESLRVEQVSRNDARISQLISRLAFRGASPAEYAAGHKAEVLARIRRREIQVRARSFE